MSDRSDFVWVTGASGGIGKALVIELLHQGFNVFATARRIALLEEMSSQLAEYKSQLLYDYCDVSDTKSIDECLDNFHRGHPSSRISCLINNAGITSFRSAERDSWEDIKQIMDTNLLGAVYAIRKALPEMIKFENGMIVNIISVAAKKISTKSSIYSASKAALKAYADVLREEVRKYNIRVLNVLPGATETAIWNETVLDTNADRMMKAEDLAKVIVLLLKDSSTAAPEEIVLRPVLGDL